MLQCSFGLQLVAKSLILKASYEEDQADLPTPSSCPIRPNEPPSLVSARETRQICTHQEGFDPPHPH